MPKAIKLKDWKVTDSKLNEKRTGWLFHPIVQIEGEEPWFADDIQGYIDKITEMMGRKDLLGGPLAELRGKFEDLQRRAWNPRGARKKSDNGAVPEDVQAMLGGVFK